MSRPPVRWYCSNFLDLIVLFAGFLDPHSGETSIILAQASISRLDAIVINLTTSVRLFEINAAILPPPEYPIISSDSILFFLLKRVIASSIDSMTSEEYL